MTDEQRAHLERRLQEERERVLTALRRFQRDAEVEDQEEDGDLSAYPQHPADLGTDAQEQEVAFANAARQTELLQAIDAALERLYRAPETFGRHLETGAEIPFERLDLVPWATE